jgi:hypothetical protein
MQRSDVRRLAAGHVPRTEALASKIEIFAGRLDALAEHASETRILFSRSRTLF